MIYYLALRPIRARYVMGLDINSSKYQYIKERSLCLCKELWDCLKMQRYQLNQSQEHEIMHTAENILASRKSDEQSWDDAWAGNYPKEASQSEVLAEYEILKAKVIRLLSGELEMVEEHADTKEMIRMIHLESCTTFNIWQNSQ